MNILMSVFLGIIQGLTEFLPVSSSGHLVLFREFFGFEGTYAGGLFFDTLLHIGTLISVFIIFHKDIKELIVEFFGLIGDLFRGKKNLIQGKPYRRMIIMLILSTLPLFLVVPFVSTIETIFFGSLLVTGFALLTTGTILFISSKLPHGTKDAGNAKFRSAFIVGIAQMFAAVIPGISRSGSTIVTGEATGFTRQFAAKFSFLMSIIAIIGATVVQLPDAIEQYAATPGAIRESLVPYIVGVVVAAITGIIAIKYMLKLINKGKFHVFAYYCWTIGTIAVVSSFFM